MAKTTTQAIEAGNKAKNTQRVLNMLRLPPYLPDILMMNTLEREVAWARDHLRMLNEQMDAWEIANPHAVHLLPWYEARQQWKAKGSPEPEWYELLWLLECPNYPIQKTEITHFEPNGTGAKAYNQKKLAVMKGELPAEGNLRKYTKKVKS